MLKVRGLAHSQGLVTQLDGGGSGGGLDRGISWVWFSVSKSNFVIPSLAAGGGLGGGLD